MTLTNTDEAKHVTLGHPSKGIVVGQLLLEDTDDTDLEACSQQYSGLLADMGLDKVALLEMVHGIVKVSFI